jgi:16S rRNA (uracil1498-N3)-methyltransferase
MRQYFLDQSFSGQARFVVSGKESQYLTKVLRLKTGQYFPGIDRDGTIWDLQLVSADRQQCVLSCSRAEDGVPRQTTDTLPSFGGPFPRIHLYQCVCKGKKVEQIVRQATEIGVHEITLVQSKFCVADHSNKKDKAIAARTERLEAHVKEAIQQSGSPIPTKVNGQAIPLELLPSHWGNRGLAIFFHQSELASKHTLGSLLETVPVDDPIAIVIGSEGGLADEECDFLERSGFKPVLLKTNILRAETAAIYAVSSIQVLQTEKLHAAG